MLPLPLAIPHAALPGLHLRRLQPQDAGPLRAIVTRPEVGRMLLAFPADWTLEQAQALIAKTAPRNTPPFRLAIDTGNGALIGTVGFVQGKADEIAYFLDPACQGQGIMRACLAGFIDMIFTQFACENLRAEVYHDNPASMGLLKALGFAQTGIYTGTCSAQRASAESLHVFDLPRAVWQAGR
ncbi:GNAT family N-acetyltransferase [Roseinatronobacter alkalisoli]|uniref:GNAT family N-acetyltransferase n=1 Tax=Roseinatronobacter alkalisoli TaxID=3028235 RepID=A0ABT5T866_9RHOB|nr:GNAT family N-acetyltransferase [Roseinatronobacter sp. HJB301]MDD7971317.1 GNAT family N-acetyltransferase [Roseinatronobacter sp. HJB301]